MKFLLYILIPLFSFSQVKNDYHLHYHISGIVTQTNAAGMYMLTGKNAFSVFFGVSVANGFGIAKELCYDKHLKKGVYSDIDLEANLKGSLHYGFGLFVSINEAEKKQIQTEKYNNLNTNTNEKSN